MHTNIHKYMHVCMYIYLYVDIIIYISRHMRHSVSLALSLSLSLSLCVPFLRSLSLSLSASPPPTLSVPFFPSVSLTLSHPLSLSISLFASSVRKACAGAEAMHDLKAVLSVLMLVSGVGSHGSCLNVKTYMQNYAIFLDQPRPTCGLSSLQLILLCFSALLC